MGFCRNSSASPDFPSEKAAGSKRIQPFKNERNRDAEGTRGKKTVAIKVADLTAETYAILASGYVYLTGERVVDQSDEN